MRYNGWQNRETWLVNLWYGDYFDQLAEDGVAITAGLIEEFVYEELFENMKIPSSSFAADMMNISAIDFDELAEHYVEDEQE